MSVPQISGGGILGKEVRDARRTLDTFTFQSANHPLDVTYTSDEVTSLCPITGQPDWYTVTIDVQNSRMGIESKSLKLYLQSFRNEGQFCEAFADTIARDVYSAIRKPQPTGWYNHKAVVRVTVWQKPRGGVSISATARRGDT